MPENYQFKKVFANMKRDAVIGRSLKLERKQNAVADVMQKQGIITDPRNLKDYKKEKFIKAIEKEKDLGYYDKKAFQEIYGKKKTEKVKPRADSKKTYDEIIGKGKNVELPKVEATRERSKVLPFGVSDKYMRGNSELIHGTNEHKDNHHTTASGGEKSDIIKEELRRIQS